MVVWIINGDRFVKMIVLLVVKTNHVLTQANVINVKNIWTGVINVKMIALLVV